MSRVPLDASLAVQQAFREVHLQLELLQSGNQNLQGRRAINAGVAQAPSDYITRDDLRVALAAATKKPATTAPTPGGGNTPTGPAGVPTPPTSLAVTVVGHTMSWTWTASSNFPTSYMLEGGTLPASINLFNTDTGNINTSYTEANVPTGYYYVRVRGKNASGVSGVSNEVGFSVNGGVPPTNPNPPSPEPIPPVPTPPPFTGAATRLISFQGATINLGAYGTLPWFGAAITSLAPADRAAVYTQLLALGDTWGMACLSWNYNEPGQPYGTINTVPGTDMSASLAAFRAIVQEQLTAGFSKVLVFMAGDGEGAGPGYNDPVGWTYGHAWLMANLSSIIAAFQLGTDITGSCIFVPGFDGIMPGWLPAELDAYLVAIRALVGTTRCVGLELGSGYSHWGGGQANWDSAAGQAVDVILQEFPGPPTGDAVWQIAGRLLGPGYHRPVIQPAADDPTPPFYLVTSTPRGARTVVAFEFETFRWVRSQVAAGTIIAARQSLADVGYLYAG